VAEQSDACGTDATADSDWTSKVSTDGSPRDVLRTFQFPRVSFVLCLINSVDLEGVDSISDDASPRRSINSQFFLVCYTDVEVVDGMLQTVFIGDTGHQQSVSQNSVLHTKTHLESRESSMRSSLHDQTTLTETLRA